MRKLSVWVILLCIILSLTACGKSETPTIPPPEDMSGIPGDVMIPDASDTPTSEPEASAEISAPEDSTTSPDKNTGSTTTNNPPANNAGGTTSRPTDPPANNTPSQPPATSTPTQPPATSTPPPAKPTYTEADYQAIINEIKKYGEGKGFIWEESYTFEQGHQYYGRPNLERDGYDGVISRLKLHCDKIATDVGICYFKVVKHIYEGNTEFVVLYD